MCHTGQIDIETFSSKSVEIKSTRKGFCLGTQEVEFVWRAARAMELVVVVVVVGGGGGGGGGVKRWKGRQRGAPPTGCCIN